MTATVALVVAIIALILIALQIGFLIGRYLFGKHIARTADDVAIYLSERLEATYFEINAAVNPERKRGREAVLRYVLDMLLDKHIARRTEHADGWRYTLTMNGRLFVHELRKAQQNREATA